MKRRIFSLILVLTMCLSMLPTAALAAEPGTGEQALSNEAAERPLAEDSTGLCPHHLQHDGDCGYIPGEDGADCGYVCGICPGEDTAEAADSEDAGDETDEPDPAVTAVQAQVDALPTVEDVQAMDTDGQREVYDHAQAAYDAYMALTEDQRALIVGAELFEVLFAFFDGQIMPLAVAFDGGDGTANNPYLISTQDQLVAVAADNSLWNKSFRLTKDINLSSVCGEGIGDWTPIGVNLGTKFTGSFDGGNNTISGLYINATGGWQGLFGSVAGGSIKDLHVEGYITARSNAGGIAGQLDPNGRIENCSFSGSVTGEDEKSGAEGQNIGGIVGHNQGKVSGCKNEGTVVSPTIYVGGIAGLSDGGEIIDCYNTGNISIYGSKAGSAGGIVGYNRASITNCHNEGSVSGTESASVVGGIAGNNSGTITQCYNTATVTGTGTNYIGGIAGNNSGVTISQCYNTATVTGNNSIGGIAGNNTSKGTLSQCYNAGSVSGTNYIGGLAGQNDGSSTVTNGYNEGTVSGSYAGGIVGRNYDGKSKGATTGIVSLCYNRGTVSGASNIGSVVGQNGNSSSAGKVTNCYYLTSLIGGIAGVNTPGQAEEKSKDTFASGEVTWLLQHGQASQGTLIWGQELVKTQKDDWSLLTNTGDGAGRPRVLKVSFLVGDTATKMAYTNSGGQVTSPAAPDAGKGYVFYQWSIGSAGGAKYLGTVTVTDLTVEEVTIVAAQQEEYAGEQDITVTGTYSPEAQQLTADLDHYMSYSTGSSTEGRFKYSLTNGTAIPGAVLSEDGKTLSIPAGLAVGSYKLSVTAHEKEPLVTTFSLSSYGTQDVKLSVTVVIEPAPLKLTVSPTAITYHQTLASSVLSGKAVGAEGEVAGKFTWNDPGIKPAVSDSGVTLYEVTFTPNDLTNYRITTGTATVTVNKATPEDVTAPTANTLTYNGAARDLVTAGSAEGGVLVYSTDGETYSETIPSHANAGTYTVYYKVRGDENHNDLDGLAPVTVTVSPYELNITPDQVTYNGEREFTVTLDGVPGADNAPIETFTATLTAGSKNAGDYKFAGNASGDSNYTVTIAEPYNNNYTVVSGGIFTVNKRPVNLQWSDLTFTYAAGTPRTVTATVTNSADGETVTVEGYAADIGNNITNTATNVGDYEARAVRLSDETNYTLTDGTNVAAVWHITPADSIVTLSAKETTITYGDTLTLTVDVNPDTVADEEVEISVNGEVFATVYTTGDEGKATCSVKATAENKFSAGTFAVKAEYNGDKNIKPGNSDAITITIDPKPVSARIEGDTAKVYDGSRDATGLEIKLDGVVEHENDAGKDDVTAAAGAYSYVSPDVAYENNVITAEKIVLSGTQSSNYTLSSDTVTTPGTITARTVGLVWHDWDNLVYDGKEKNVYATANELVAGETVTVTVIGGNKKNAGVNYTATATGLTNTAGETDPNYALPNNISTEQKYTITPATLTVPAKTVAYNGNSVFTVEMEGVNGETVTATITAADSKAGSYEYAPSEGAGKYTAEIQDQPDRPDSKNYILTGGGLLTVEKVNWTVEPPKATDHEYNGQFRTLATAGSVKEDGGRMEYSFDKSGGYTDAIPTGLNVSEYQIWYQVLGDDNHNAYGPEAITAKITQARLDIPQQTFTYDGGKVFTVPLTGINGEPVTATLTTNSPNVGEYSYITAGGEKTYTAALSNSNYTLGDEQSLTIVAREITLEWHDWEGLVYNGKEKNVYATAAAGSLMGDDECPVKVTGGNMIYAGTGYIARAESLDNPNYILPAEKTRSYDIQKAELNIPAQKLPYSGSNTFTVEIVSEAGDTVTVTLTASGANAGDYAYGAENNGYTADIDNKNYTVVGGETLTIEKVDPAYTAPTAKGGTYNGSAQPLIEAGTAQGGTMVYSTDGETYSETIPSHANAGEYTVYYKVKGDENHNDIGPWSVTATIGKAKLNIPEQSFTYDGGSSSLQVTLTDGSGGVVNNETVTVTLTANSPNAGEYTYGGVERSFSAEIAAPNDLNYTVETAGTLTIGQRPVILLWNDPLTFTYNGSQKEVSATVGNKQGNDTDTDFTLEYDGHTGTLAGGYEAKVTDLGNENYTLTGASGVTQAWRINPEQSNVTLTANPEATAENPITYGDNLTLTAKIDPNIAEGDAVTFYVNGQPLSGDVAMDYADSTAAITVEATSGNNFSVSSNVVRVDYDSGNTSIIDDWNSITVTVAPKDITAVIAPDATPTSKVYDGDRIAAALELKLEGLESCDEDYVSVAAASFTYNSKDRKDANTITAEGITISGGAEGNQSGNYTLTNNTAAIGGTITPKTVGLLWHDWDNLVYDGREKNVYATANELVAGETLTVTVTGGNEKNAGANYTATASLDDLNYALPATGATQTYNIAPAQLTVPAKTVTYNGNAVLTAEIDGVNGETVTATLTAASPNAGSYGYAPSAGAGKYTAKLQDQPDRPDSKNYTITNGGTLTIEKAEWNVTPPAAKQLTYNGKSQKLIEAGSTGGTMTYSLDGEDYSTAIPDGTDAGAYAVWYTVAGDVNHNTYGPASLEVDIAPAPVTVPDKTFSYTGRNTFTVDVVGVNNETVTVTLIAASADVGTYEYAASAAEEKYTTHHQNGNYTVTGGGTLTIKKSNSAVKPSEEEITIPYGEPLTLSAQVLIAPLALENRVEFFLNGDSLGSAPVAAGGGEATLTVQASRANGFSIGSHRVTAQYGGSVNLNGSESEEITVTVVKRPLTAVISGPDSKVYDGTTDAPAGTSIGLNGVLPEDTVNITAAAFAYNSPDVDTATEITATGVTLSGEHTEYYSFDPDSAVKSASITKADPSYTAPTPINSEYTGQAQALVTGGTASGGEMQYSLSKDGPWSTAIPTGTNAGTYTVWYRVAGDRNHSDIAPQSVLAGIGVGDPNDPNNPNNPNAPGTEIKLYTVTFNPTGGECSVQSMKTKADGTLPSLPSATLGVLYFAGWYTDWEGGTRVTQYTVFETDTTVYAHWSVTPVTGDESDPALWAALMVMSLGAMGTILVRGTRRKARR